MGIHQWPGNFPHKGPDTRKCFHLMTSSWSFPTNLISWITVSSWLSHPHWRWYLKKSKNSQLWFDVSNSIWWSTFRCSVVEYYNHTHRDIHQRRWLCNHPYRKILLEFHWSVVCFEINIDNNHSKDIRIQNYFRQLHIKTNEHYIMKGKVIQ